MQTPIAGNVIVSRHESVPSTFLGREVQLSILLPPAYRPKPYPVLWLNDGQDIPSVQLIPTLVKLYEAEIIPHIIIVGIHAGEHRLQEYGTSELPDFRHRGSRAGLYERFVMGELLPFIRQRYNISSSPARNVFAGWSLGGLMALDIAWNNSRWFGRTGVFSGSLWWRSKGYGKGYRDDKHRIIHQVISRSPDHPPLKFWFECGTEDEHADRNHNGVIDSIDDTIDLIRILKEKGYHNREDIELVIVKGGKHDQETWGEVMPRFLQWSFGK